MKKTNQQPESEERDTLRPEYDFKGATRGATATRYAEGVNVVIIEPDVLDVFPDSASVNEVLRALAPVIRNRRQADNKSETA